MKELHDYKIYINDKVKVENIWLEVSQSDSKYIIGGIYRHPNSSILNFYNAIDPVLCKISSQNISCFIAGDINIDLIKCRTNNQTLDYVHNLLTHNFLPTVIMPTRITERSATLIDHIYYYEGNSSRRNLTVKSGNFINDLTDHLPNYTIVIKTRPDYKDRPLTRVFSKANKEKFANDLASTDCLRSTRCKLCM